MPPVLTCRMRSLDAKAGPEEFSDLRSEDPPTSSSSSAECSTTSAGRSRRCPRSRYPTAGCRSAAPRPRGRTHPIPVVVTEQQGTTFVAVPKTLFHREPAPASAAGWFPLSLSLIATNFAQCADPFFSPPSRAPRHARSQLRLSEPISTATSATASRPSRGSPPLLSPCSFCDQARQRYIEALTPRLKRPVAGQQRPSTPTQRHQVLLPGISLLIRS
jgi:hypothetical protein